MILSALRAPAVVLRISALGLLLPAGCLLATFANAQTQTATALPPAAPASAPSASAAALRVDIEAPADLKALLTRHLDLARLAQLRDDEALDDSEWRRLTAAAPAQAREILQTEGYFEPQISVLREPGTPIRVRLTVLPGPRVQVATLDVRSSGALATPLAAGQADARALDQKLQSGGPLRPGQPFRNPLWSETKLQWISTLRAAGYAAAQIESSAAEVDVATASAKLNGVVDSGPRFLAGSLLIEGLVRQDPATARRLAGFQAGEPLTETLLLDYQDRLQKAGLYESVNVSFDPQLTQATASTVTVRLGELPLQQLTAGLGASTDTGPRTSLEYMHRLPFGQPVTAYNKLEWGHLVQRWAGDFLTHPGVGNTRNLLGVLIDREVSDTDTVLTQRVRLGRTRDTPQLERLVFIEGLRSRQSVDTGAVNDARAVSANVHLVLRRLDSLLLPTRGFSLSLQTGAGQASSNTGDKGPYARLYGRLTGYLPLGNSWYANARVEVGHILKRDSVVVPDALGFRAGGDDSVRGYGYRTLAPSVGGNIVSGNSLLTLSAELAHPIVASMPAVQGAVFVDAGRAVDRWADYKPAVGYGVGVRWRSPIGPLRADVAWGQEVHKARLHLTVGITF